MSDIYDALCGKVEVLFERISSLERLLLSKLDAQDKALTVAKDVMDHRLEGMNEFREQLNAQTRTFISKSEFETRIVNIQDKLDALSERIQKVELIRADIQGRIWTLGIVLSILIVVMEFMLHYILRV